MVKKRKLRVWIYKVIKMDLYEARMMDKGELHVHLNGLVSTQVIRGLEKILLKCLNTLI